jgi:hypothetical protein
MKESMISQRQVHLQYFKNELSDIIFIPTTKCITDIVKLFKWCKNNA